MAYTLVYVIIFSYLCSQIVYFTNENQPTSFFGTDCQL